METIDFMLEGDDSLLARAIDLPKRFPDGIGFDDGRETGYEFILGDEPRCGGNAVVHQVRKPSLSEDDRYALKVLLMDLDSSAEDAQRWSIEKTNLNLLANCKNVPAVQDSGTIHGLPVIIMRWVEGPTLCQHLNSDCWSPSSSKRFDVPARILESLHWIALICYALSEIRLHLRDKGWKNPVHGDLHPGNIKLQKMQSGRWKAWLLDFGEASLKGRSGLEGVNRKYASPELVASYGDSPTTESQINHRSDQYQIGACLAELIQRIDYFLGSLFSKPATRPRFTVENLNPLLSWYAYKIRLAAWHVCHPASACALFNARHVARKMTSRNPQDRFRSFFLPAQSLRRPIRALLLRHIFFAVTLLALCVSSVAFYNSKQRELELRKDNAELQTSARELRQEIGLHDNKPLTSEERQKLVDGRWLIWLYESSFPDFNALQDSLDNSHTSWSNQFGTQSANKIKQDLERRLQFLRNQVFRLDLAAQLPDGYQGYSVPLQISINGQLYKQTLEIDANNRVVISGLLINWAPGQTVEFVSFIDISKYKVFSRNDIRITPTTIFTGPFSILKAFGCQQPNSDGSYSGILKSDNDDRWNWNATLTPAPVKSPQ